MARRLSFSASLIIVLSLAQVAPCDEPAGGNDAATAAAEAQAAEERESDEEYYELYKVFADTLDHVERNYVKPVTRRELMEAAIRGVLDKLDPYSSFISPDEISQFKTSVESQFGGIGIQVTMDRGQLKILSPLVGSPAYRAGLQAGDSIVKIEDQSTEGISLDEAVRRLKGEAGSAVNITVARPGGGEQTVRLVREVVRIETVMGDRRKEDDAWDFMLDHDRKIGYIRLTAFSRETARELEDALDDLVEGGLRGLILDLRFNPGGLLTSAIEVADLFITEGRIVSTEGRNSPERVWEARRRGTFDGFPMVVLVNRYSASASEIVSACLQDHERAVVVGERTWGKGSVQNVIELEEGRSALKLTTASYLRPNGHNIHRFPDSKETDEWGVMPNKGYEVKLSDGETRQLVMSRRDRDILLINHYRDSKSNRDKAAEPPAERPAADDSTPPEDRGDSPPAIEAPDAAQPRTEGDEAEASSDREFVDRQMQKAVDYLSTEMARAG